MNEGEVDVFSVSVAAQHRLGELPKLDDLRACLRALPATGTPRQRARLHLSIAIVMQDRDHLGTHSAIQEARQAVELLKDERGQALAAARFQLGRLLLVVAVGEPRDPPDPVYLAEARHVLELARGDFESLGDLEAVALTAVELGFATEREGDIGRAFEILDKELSRAPAVVRGVLRLWKATIGLRDPAHQREASSAVVAFIKEDASTDADEHGLCELLGMFHQELLPEAQRLALDWLEARPKPPMAEMIVLRSRLYPDSPEAWIRAEERALLEAALVDPGTPPHRRQHTAHLLLANLPVEDRDLRLRCAEMLEEAILSEAVPLAQRLCYQNDVAVAYKLLSNGDRGLVSRAVHHLEAALGQVFDWDTIDVATNLGSSYAALLEIDSAVSSPSLLDHVRRIEDILTSFLAADHARCRDLRMHAICALLRWQALTHPACLAEARRLLREVLSKNPRDVDALRFAHLGAWCAFSQGRGTGAAVDSARKALERIASVPEIRLSVPPRESPESLARLVRVLARTEAASAVEPTSLAAAAQVRPDAVELLLDIAEERARLGAHEDPSELLETLSEALLRTYGGDVAERGRRMSALVVSLAPRLSGRKIGHILSILRGPIGSEVEKALRASSLPIDEDSAVVEELPLAEQIQSMQARALQLFQEAAQSGNKEQAIELLHEARELLDDALERAGSLPVEHRAVVQVSAGNARRHLAKLQPSHAPVLLQQAIDLYREALPWTSLDSDHRARTAKVLAQTLIERGVSSDWEEAKRLFSEALGIRRDGQFRAETLLALIDAELAHPARPRAVSVTAALHAACEALEHVAPQEENLRLRIAGRGISLLAEAVRGNGLTAEAGAGFAGRIRRVCPKLDKHAALAAFGLEQMASREDGSAIITSEFRQSFVHAAESSMSPLAAHAVPPDLVDKLPVASLNEQRHPNDAIVLQREERRWRADSKSATGEKRAGYLVAVARLVARRVELGDASPQALEEAFEEAYSSLAGITRLEIRAFASSELAVVWSEHHAARDFARSARLLEESVRLFREAGSSASTDTLQYLARATRFRADLPFASRLKDAIRMYQEAAGEYQAQGNAGGYMICLLNLAEALALQEDRPRAVAIKEALAVDRIALDIARLRGDRTNTGILLGNIAWSLTQLAEDVTLPMEERLGHLKAAGGFFDEALKVTEDPERLRGLQNNYLSFRELRGDSTGAVITARRQQLASTNRHTHPHDWSFAAHNLAELLVRPGAWPADIKEALTLYRGALALRPIAAAPELHWECAHQIGALLGGERYPGDLPSLRDLGISPEDAYREATTALRSALDAAGRIGLGRRLVTAARTLGLVAAAPPGHLPPDVASVHQALEILADVLRIAPEDAHAAGAEADVARALLVARAKQQSSGAPRVGHLAVIDGVAAWELVHLVLSSRGARHRRLRTRMARPDDVDPATWTRWRRLLRERDNYSERRAVAVEIQNAAPAFLAPTASLDRTTAWLREGRAAASLVMTDTMMILVVLRSGESGLTPAAVIAEIEPAPLFEEAAGDTFASAVKSSHPDQTEAARRVEALRTWLTDTVVSALKQVLPPETKELCWSPNGLAAWFPLEVLWPTSLRVWTTPCITLPPPSGRVTEHDSVLLVCADPLAPGRRGSLPDMAPTVAGLAESFASAARAEVLAGAGRAFGHALLPDDPRDIVTNRPASPDEVLARAQGRRLLLILAHGTFNPEDPARSSFLLVDAKGKEAPLTAEQISERPGLLKDTVVVLLSCETGAAGRMDTGPAGLAGALLSVGAQAVVAPLWPVLLNTAIEVGRLVVVHLAAGGAVEDLPDIVRAARGKLDASSGRNDLLHAPFVVWCG